WRNHFLWERSMKSFFSGIYLMDAIFAMLTPAFADEAPPPSQASKSVVTDAAALVEKVAAQSVRAADSEAGKQLATAVCAACHGPSGISVGDSVPNLAGQRAGYIVAQLKFFKDGTRKEPGT